MDELKQLEEQKTALHDDIEKYGIKLEEVKSELQAAQNMREDVGLLSEQVSELRIEKVNLENARLEVVALEAKKNAILADIEVCKNLLDGMSADKKEAEDLTLKVASLTEEVKKDTERKILLDKELEITQSKIEAAHASLEKLETYFTTRKESLEKYLSDREEAITKIVAEKEAFITSTAVELNEVMQNVANKQDELQVLQNKISMLMFEASTLEQDNKHKIADADAIIAVKNQALKVREDAVQVAEGGLSLKDAALDKKRIQIMNIKARVEQESGKSISIEV